MIHSVETSTNVISLHVTRDSAIKALHLAQLRDAKTTYFILEYGVKDFVYAFAAVLAFASIGMLLAWRG